jgi:hypothetical protein
MAIDNEIVQKVLELDMRLKRQENLMERILGILDKFCDDFNETYNIKEGVDGEG